MNNRKQKGWHSTKRDQYTVVLEDLRSHFKAFGENLDFVRSDVKGIKETVGAHNDKLDSHTQKLDSHTQKLDSHTQKLDSHTQMIARIMEDVEEIKSGMREKIDRSEFVKLEKRMVVLETTVFGGKNIK